MSHNGTLNISRDDVGEVRRVFILKNGGNETVGCDGQGVAPLSRTPSISNATTQHGGSDSGGINGNCDSDNVINGMLRAGEEDVDPTSDLGADLQHIEEWLKTRSDSLSSFDFDSEIKPSEIDISDLFNLKSSVQFHVGGQDYGLVFSKDGANDAGTSSSTLPSQFTFPDMGDNLSGSGSRRNSFTKRLETLMQVDKGLFEELLLTDQGKKCGAKKLENMPSLPAEDRGLFEELLLPGAQEEWARLLAVTMEKKESVGSGSAMGESESLPEPMECSDPLPSSTQEASTSQESTDELDLMVRNIQPIKLMSPQEIENMASRPLGFDETPVKAEGQRSREVANQIEEDFNFHPFGTRGCDDSSTLPQDILASPNSEVDSKLSSILAMDASNDTLEIESSSASDMLENLNKTPPKPERSISPGTFLVKLEPKENQASQDKSSSNTFSLSHQTATVMPPPPTTLSTTTSHGYSTSVPISILDVSDISNIMPRTVTTNSNNLIHTPVNSTMVSLTATTTTTTTSVNMAPKGLLKIPSGLVRAELKKLPVGMVQLRLATPPVSSSTAVATTNAAPTTTVGGAQLPRPAFILRPLIAPGQQMQQQAPQPSTMAPKTIAPPKENTPLTLTPLKVVAVQPPSKPGTANVTITVDRKANLTTVNIVSSNKEHTVFKINTCDLVRAVSSIREPHLEPLGLTPQQLLRSAHTAHRLIQEVHQGTARQTKTGGKDGASGPQNFEINQVLQEVKAPISRMQQGQLALLRQAAATARSTPVTSALSPTASSGVVTCNSVGSSIIGTAPVFVTASASGLTGKPPVTSVTEAVLTTAKGIQTSLASQKTQIDSSPPSTCSDGRASRLPVISSPDKSQCKYLIVKL